EVGVDAEFLDGVDDRADVDASHDDVSGRWAIAACARRPSSFGDTFSVCVAIDHWFPNGSSSLPNRSPQNMSVSSISTLQPEFDARLKAASTSRTERKSETVVPPRDCGERQVLMPG